jgi:hypothetical protein
VAAVPAVVPVNFNKCDRESMPTITAHKCMPAFATQWEGREALLNMPTATCINSRLRIHHTTSLLPSNLELLWEEEEEEE